MYLITGRWDSNKKNKVAPNSLALLNKYLVQKHLSYIDYANI